MRSLLPIIGFLIVSGLTTVPSAAEQGKGGMMHHAQGMHGQNIIKENFYDFMRHEFQLFMQESETIRKDLAVAAVELRTVLSQNSPDPNQIRQLFTLVRNKRAELLALAESKGLPPHSLKMALGPLAHGLAGGSMKGMCMKMGAKHSMMDKGKPGAMKKEAGKKHGTH